MILSRAFLVVQLGVQYSVQQNWCDMKCGKEEHTMCRYKEEPTVNNGTCSNMVDAMNEANRQTLLGLHNYVRNYIAAGTVPGWPEASNMRQLTWDDKSELVARRWAFQCENAFDECRKTPDFNNIGQNIGIARGEKDTLSVAQIFGNWLNQILFSSGSNVDPFKHDDKYGFFSAMVWAETYKIGCGLVNLSYRGSTVSEFRQILVCNYAPAGNTDGKSMWTKGDACSNCPNGTACNATSTYRNLCALPGDPSWEAPIPIDIPSCESRSFNFISPILLVSLVIFNASRITRSKLAKCQMKRVY